MKKDLISMEIEIEIIWMLLLCSGSASVASESEEEGWQASIATWYGPRPPYGDRSKGGACKYGSLVKETGLGFDSRRVAMNPLLYQGGKGCITCYQVKCDLNGICSQIPVSVVVTDECPGCNDTHIDLSGNAFADVLYDPHRSNELLDYGLVNIHFQRVPCEYPGINMAFQVSTGSSDYWFSVLIEFEDGDGDLGPVYLKQASSDTWQAMTQSWGANWVLTAGPLIATSSLRTVSLSTGKIFTSNEIIPQNWQSGYTYKSLANYAPILTQ